LPGSTRRLRPCGARRCCSAGWIAGPIVTLLLHGALGLLKAIVNLALASPWVLLKRRFTPEPPPAPVCRPRLELAGRLAVFAMLFAVQLLYYRVIIEAP
jgi:hypothetical protein